MLVKMTAELKNIFDFAVIFHSGVGIAHEQAVKRIYSGHV